MHPLCFYNRCIKGCCDYYTTTSFTFYHDSVYTQYSGSNETEIMPWFWLFNDRQGTSGVWSKARAIIILYIYKHLL